MLLLLPGCCCCYSLDATAANMKQLDTVDPTYTQVVHIMLGDLQRIREYPAKGFQVGPATKVDQLIPSIQLFGSC